MSLFQRMIVIPQEEYLQLSTVQSARQPLTQQFYNLESQYNQDAEIKDPYKRLFLQSEKLEDMKRLKDQMRHYLTVDTPKPYRSRAQALFENLSTFLRYNERGEIFDKDNRLLENTRLEDLIQHAVRDRRRNISPTGWTYFLKILREYNIPKSILNRGTLDEMDEELNKVKLIMPSPLKPSTSTKRKSKLPIPDRYLKSKSEEEEHEEKATPVRRSSRKRTLTQRVLDSFEKY